MSFNLLVTMGLAMASLAPTSFAEEPSEVAVAPNTPMSFPNRIDMPQKYFRSKMNFTLNDKNKHKFRHHIAKRRKPTFGHVKARRSRQGWSFSLISNEGQLEATATRRNRQGLRRDPDWGKEIEVWSAGKIMGFDRVLLGRIREVLTRYDEKSGVPYIFFQIISPQGLVVAVSDEFDTSHGNITLRAEQGGAELAKFVRRERFPRRKLQNWTISFKDQETVDPRVMIFLPAFTTKGSKELN